MPYLVGVRGVLAGRTIPIEHAPILGRAFDADIRIDDPAISRHHARIAKTSHGCVLTDLASTHGTYLNDKLLCTPALLKDGDVIRLMQNMFRFSLSEESEGRSSVVSVTDGAMSANSAIIGKLDAGSASAVASRHGQISEHGELQKAHERLQTVMAIGNAIHAKLNLDQLLEEILLRLFGVFSQAERGFVMLKDDETSELEAKAMRHRSEIANEAISVSRHVIDEVARDRVSLLVADTMGDARFSKTTSIQNLKIRSMLCAPLLAEGEFVGVIHLDTTDQRNRFNMDDLDLLTGVANQTAVAISNARIHRRLMEQQEIAYEMRLARKVQRNFLPDRVPVIPGMQFCGTYHAAHEVGGDFYDFIPLQDGRVAFVIGDVVGKGVPAALLMARLNSNTRFLSQSGGAPLEVVSHLNEDMLDSSAEGVFATLVFGTVDPKTRHVTMVNAGHLPPVLRRKRAEETSEFRKALNFPVGVTPEPEYEQDEFELEQGDVLCLFSDGVTEALNANCELYGIDRALGAIAQSATGAQAVMDNLLSDIRAFVGHTAQADDLAVICLEAE